jgi:hypothetical protein
MQKKINSRAKIVYTTPSRRSFATSIENTGMSQRETLEAIIINLADHLGIEEIFKTLASQSTRRITKSTR